MARESPPKDIDVWVLAGQSNMYGCGYVAEALAPDERVWRLLNSGRWEIAREPLHFDWEGFESANKDKSDEERKALLASATRLHAGPGLSFGKAMAEALGRPIGLVPTAVGGTSLDEWSPTRAGGLYSAMLAAIRRAGGRLRGILWYQGESDAQAENTANTYAERMTNWIETVRKDVGDPDLPVFLVQIGRMVPEAPGVAGSWNKVREAIYELPLSVAHTAVTSAVDLGMTDIVHINAVSGVRLGRRLARLALGNSEGYAGPRVARVDAVEAVPLAWDWQPAVLRVVCEGVTGSWLPTDNMIGFGVFTENGTASGETHVINAAADAVKAGAIRIVLSRPLAKGEHLGYAQGVNPRCNVVDEADMPVCAFLWKGRIAPLAEGGR